MKRFLICAFAAAVIAVSLACCGVSEAEAEIVFLQDVMEPQDGQRECFGKYQKKSWLLLRWKTGTGKQ